MSKLSFITEYQEENIKTAQFFAEDDFTEPEGLIITFMEEAEHPKVDEDFVLIPASDEDVSEFSELDADEVMDAGDLEAMHFRLPGATDYVHDDEEDDDEDEKEEEKETDWENDRDPKHFMKYILEMYPAKIPSHDGKSTLGCERAILWLNERNSEISEALRSDHDDCLDLPTLEDMRVRMLKDTVVLKNHVKELNRKHKKVKKKSDFEAPLIKEASTPKIQLIMTPFERAITGIILNSTISAGKPLEDVYEHLKKKYKFEPREELSIMQLLMDMGQPIFKDRGIIGEKEDDNDQEGQGFDFIKNYFA